MATSTPTYAPPAAVTIPGDIALDAIALLDAYAEILSEFRLDGEVDPFYNLNDKTFRSLTDVLGYDTETDLDSHPWWDTMKTRSTAFETAIRGNLDGPALGAIAATKMAYDISEVKARLGYDHA